jgi:hypothetical protein
MQQVKKKRILHYFGQPKHTTYKKSHSDVLLQKKAPIFSKLFKNNTVTTRYTTSFHLIFSTQKIKEKYNFEGEKTKS